MSTIVFSQGDATITVPAGGSIAVASYAEAQAFEIVGFPNFPEQSDLLGVFENNEITVFGPFTGGATIQIQAGATEVLYNVGVAPTIPELTGGRLDVTATAVNVTGAVSAAAILGGIVTSTTAAAVAGTVPTGTVMAAAVELAVGEGVEWSVINTGPDTFTVTAAADHTVTGDDEVATTTSGRFLTVQTAAGVFVSYRVS
jgi:hypothetical protein